MSDTLLHYYERELDYIRRLGRDFAGRYPGVAARLRLEEDQCADPHVERLIESVAFLTSRVQLKLDDEFPQLTDALLGVLYPHYLAPVPSMAVIQFEPDAEQVQTPQGFTIPAHSRLTTRRVGDLACTFRTCYPVRLWPVELTDAELLPPPFPSDLQPPPGTAAVLRLQFRCQGRMKFADLGLDQLRFYLSGESPAGVGLTELLFNHVSQVVFRPPPGVDGPAPVVLKPDDCLTPVGFEKDEGLLPYPNQSFLGYRLLTEFFTFPSKFWFFDLGGWRRAGRSGRAGRSRRRSVAPR